MGTNDSAPLSLIDSDWVRPGLKLLCACSGGLDSTVLLHLLKELPEIELQVVHFDHQARGIESDMDGEHVRELSHAHGLEFHLISEDISEYSKLHDLSFEEAGSRRRRVNFEKVLNLIHFDYIVLGQHLDDQIETLLLNLYHGTGIQGLGGMSKLHNQYLRPLLGISKARLEQFAVSEGIMFRRDATNDDPSFLRNRIRLELLPSIDSGDALELQALMRDIGDQSQDLDKLMKASADVIDNIDISSSLSVKIPLGMRNLVDYFSPIQKVIFDRAFRSISLYPQGLSTRHYFQLKSLLPQAKIGSHTLLANSIVAYRNRKDITFIRPNDYTWVSVKMDQAEKASFPFFGFEIVSINVLKNLSDGHCFWYSYAESEYLLRPAQEGDSMVISESGKRITVNQILQEARIAPHLKSYFPVLQYHGDIVWIPGIRTASVAMLKLEEINENDVKHCIKVDFKKGTFE